MNRRALGPGATTLLAAMLLIACTTTTEEGSVGVHRSQLLLVSSAEMEKTAATQYTQLIQTESPKGNVNKDPGQTERVRAIAKRLIPETVVFRKDALDWKWDVNVLTSKEVNAWCMPGGKIAVYTGLIEALHITDDELAAVMGHEISHALREHGRERYSQEVAANTGASILGVVADIFLPGSGQLATAGAGLGAQYGLLLPY
jgi:Zn-dependent protease with chaperone function